jgi:hypothetical protein
MSIFKHQQASNIASSGHDRKWIIVSLGLSLVFFAIYKFIYPQPDFFPESYKYVTAANEGLAVHFRLPGYVWFLRLLHVFSSSANLVVWVQYALLTFGSLFLYYSIQHLLNFRSRIVQMMSLAGFALNPLIPVLSNQIGCEALFTALEIIWFALLLWGILKPSWVILLLQSFSLCLLFVVKENAWHLLLLSIIALVWMVNAGWRYKLVGLILTLCAIGTLFFLVKKQTKEVTGVAVYSGLHGWQMANNALYIYPYTDNEQFKDAGLRLMDSIAKAYFASMTAIQQQQFKAEKVGSDFLWDNNAPLKKYLALYQDQYKLDYLTAWYRVSTIFEQYGWESIRCHPAAYVQHFMVPNIKNFIYPNPESLAAYNAFHERWPEETTRYFRISDREINPVDHSGLQHLLIIIYRILHALAILFCFIMPVIYLLNKNTSSYKRLTFYWLVFLLVSSLYSIAASFVLLRNEGIWYVLALGLPLWLLGELIYSRSSISVK